MCVGTAGSIPRAAFYIPVVQVMEQRSPKPQVAGLSPAGNASCVPCEGAAQIAGHLAAKVPDAAALCTTGKAAYFLKNSLDFLSSMNIMDISELKK